jgi:glycosyltransferase involved in cell wall biosynthesis
MISVLIPTANRPDFLKHSIASVVNQSRLDLIREIIVSDNGSIDVSDVVSGFRNASYSFPIHYVKQVPQLTAGLHFKELLCRASSEWVAMLADDDMWGRYHLEEACRLLKKHTEAIAVFGQTICVRNSFRQPIGCIGELIHSFSGSDSQPFDDAFVFKQGEIFIDALIRTPLDIWAMVVKREAIERHISVLSDPNAGADSDRFFLWRLNTEGAIVVTREVGLYLRLHDGMAGALMRGRESQKFLEISKAYSLKIIEEARQEGIPVQEKWAEFWGHLSIEAKQMLISQSCNDHLLVACNAFGDQLPSSGQQQGVKAFVTRVVKDILPPFVYRLILKPCVKSLKSRN